MLFPRTIALAITLLASLIAADDPKVDITFHKWGTLNCSAGSGDEVGDSQSFSVKECFTFDHIFTSFTYTVPTFLKAFALPIGIGANDYKNPTCKVVVYPGIYCQGVGWTPGQIAVNMDKCFNVPEEFGDQMGFNITGSWAKSAGVFCGVTANGATEMAEAGFIKPGSAPYDSYPTWEDD